MELINYRKEHRETTRNRQSIIRKISLRRAFLHICCFTMATFHVQDLKALIVKFEANIKNYAIIRQTSPPDVSRNIENILSWVEGEKRNAKRQSKENKISKVGNVIERCVDSLESLSSENSAQVMKGCLGIASSVAVVVGGPYGAAAVAICSIFSSIISASSLKGPDLVTVFTDVVHAELLKFSEELKWQTFEGLRLRVKNMNAALKELRRGPNHTELPDKVLYETDFPQFIGEVARNFLKGLDVDSKEEEVNYYLTSMVIYCNAQTALFLLLTNILATFQSTGRETNMIKRLMDTQVQDAQEKLGFLSEEKYLRMSSLFTAGTYTAESITEDDVRKVVNIRHFRKCRHLPGYDIIEGFREGLGMPKLQKTLVGLFPDGSLTGAKGISHLYPQPQTKGDNHYFQLINHSHVPVRVECGMAGNHVNGLRFCQDVPPYSSYEHVATKSAWTFSTGGVFTMYLSGNTTSSETRNLKVFEFALSNPFIGICKSAILEKNPQLSAYTGKDCWEQMNSNASPPIHFEHCDKYYVVRGGYTSVVALKGVHDFPGKNGCRTWRFVIQEYDPLEDLEGHPCFFL